MRLALTASQAELDGTVIPLLKEKVPQAAGLVEAKLNQPIDLTLKYALEPGKVVELNLVVEESS